MLMWNLMATVSLHRNDHLEEALYDTGMTRYIQKDSTVHTTMLYMQSSLHKTFSEIGLTLKWTGSYHRDRSLVSQNLLLTHITANTVSTDLALIASRLKWLKIYYSACINWDWQDHEQGSMLRSFYQEAGLHLLPLRQVQVKVSAEQSTVETDHGHYETNCYLDAMLRWNCTKRIEADLSASNLLNRQRYIEASHTGLNYSYYARPLRGREIQMTLCYHF